MAQDICTAQAVDCNVAARDRKPELFAAGAIGIASSAKRATPADFLAGIDTPVVYFLLCGGQCEYVGQTTQFRARMRAHLRDIRYDAVYYADCPADMLDDVERHWITQLHPPANRQLSRRMAAVQRASPPGFAKYHRIADAAQRCNINRRTLLSAVERGELDAATLGCGLRVVTLPAVRRWAKQDRKRGPKPRTTTP